LNTDDGANVTEESLTEKQIQASAEILEKLIAEGHEVVSGITSLTHTTPAHLNMHTQLLKIIVNIVKCDLKLDYYRASSQ
jgi:hypothetical protein